MIKTTTIAITAILAVLLIYLFPKQTISPGGLSRGHLSMENDCMKCHTMFFGTPGEKCAVCHKPAEIGIITTAGNKIEKKTGQVKAAFHHLFSADSCMSCHTDHSGQDMNKSAGKFSHSLFQGKNMDRCRTCHQAPDDAVHRGSGQECSQCHTPDRWRPATLDHAQYFRFDKDHKADCASCHQNNNYKAFTCYGCHEHAQAKVRQEHEKAGIYSYQNCILCHKGGNIEEAKGMLKSIRDQHASADRTPGRAFIHPEGNRKSAHNVLNNQSIHNCVSCHRSPFDNLHQTGNRNCSQCHSSDRWRPATLDHAKYFRFDRQHRPDCLACHRDNNYREYTCYGCHEHAPGRIQEEHLEEGIRNYQDCAACHRSSNEDEAKRVSRSGRYQDRSWNSLERGDRIRKETYRESGYNYYKRDADDDHDEDHDRRDDHDDD